MLAVFSRRHGLCIDLLWKNSAPRVASGGRSVRNRLHALATFSSGFPVHGERDAVAGPLIDALRGRGRGIRLAGGLPFCVGDRRGGTASEGQNRREQAAADTGYAIGHRFRHGIRH